MSLAKKASRHITVNGERFRWSSARDLEPDLMLIVQSATGAGQRLVKWMGSGQTISPGMVHRAILCAMEVGWCPHSRGPDLVFRLVGGHSNE